MKYEVRTYIDGIEDVTLEFHAKGQARRALLNQMHSWLTLSGAGAGDTAYSVYIADGYATVTRDTHNHPVTWYGCIVENTTFPDVPDDALIVMVSSDFSYHPRAFATWQLAYDALCEIVPETARHELAADMNRAIAAYESPEPTEAIEEQREYYNIVATEENDAVFTITRGFNTWRFYIVTPEEGNE